MICTRCNRETAAPAGRCDACGAPLVPDASGGTVISSPVVAAPGQTGAETVLPGVLASDLGRGDRARQPAAATDEHTTAAGVGWAPAGAGAGGTQPGGGAPGGTAGDASSALVGEQLGYRYRIIRLLGAGGMGAVYQAWDEVLSVVVALKTIRPEVAADPETARMLERRFKQELLLARRVTHKNIVRVHDMGDVGGIKYITMPFLEGKELAKILEQEGKLSVPRVMTLARSVASGLVAAHGAGVVHRDLKPANIMVDAAGEGLVMDFGVARSADAPGAGGHESGAPAAGVPSGASAGHTMAGSIVGTIAYMAPEQARAQPVDQRADVYAFGLILYDALLGGVRAKSADSAVAELMGRMEKPPPPPRAVDPSIPETLDRIIARCILPDADARYGSVADVLQELQKLDDDGKPLPIVRRLTAPMMAGVAAIFVALIGLTWWLASGPAVPVEHEPVSVVIADIVNQTGDPTFDRTLEPVLQLALEGAGFISAYDRAGIRRSLGVRPPESLDEQAATELAVKEGVNVVLAGSVAQQGGRYDVSVKAIEAVSGNVITTASQRASRKEDVLGVATELAGDVREALGDTTSDSVKRFAMETLTTRSIDAVREYAKGMDGFSRSQFDVALQSFTKAAELDPEFGLAYGGMAIASRNLDRLQDAEKYANEAMRHVDGMTERERFRARGLYYSITSDYEACVKEYGDLIAQFSADAAARNNRATCLAFLRDLPKAVEEMKQVVRILPKRALYRENLALYSAYSGDFRGAVQQVGEMTDAGLFALIARAFAELGEGRLAAATRTYETFPAVDPGEGPSYKASGLGDIALYEGRYADAIRILSEGAEADEKAESPDKAASKVIAVAYAELQRGRTTAAIAAAERAMALSPGVKIQFLAGRIFIDAGEAARAEQIAIKLGGSLKAEPQAYASLLEGLRALSVGNYRLAVKSFTEANTALDSWIGHFDLGRAYLAAGEFIQADSEFDRCIVRKGEALTLFMDEEPTFGYFPPVLYYQGLAREGLKSLSFADSFRAYLQIRGKSTEDPLVDDARKRAGG